MRNIFVSLLFGAWALLMPMQSVLASQLRKTDPLPVVMGDTGTSFRIESTLGVTQSPYIADTAHLNKPTSVNLGADGKLYVTEEFGARLLRYSTSGVNDLVIGTAGVSWAHESFLPNPQVSTLAPNGHIWVGSNTVVKEFETDGTLVQMIPENDPWFWGGGDYHFTRITGLAVSTDGNLLFVSDQDNQRVQIYDISAGTAVYFHTIGVEQQSGNDNDHFNIPRGLDFDSTGALFVMDSGNYRVQKCVTADNWDSWSCAPFFGGSWGDDPANNQMRYGITLFVDASDNVFITDSENGRVLKCTPTGDCTHFIGTRNERGLDGGGKIRFGWLSGITGAPDGSIYISDYEQNVVRKFSATGTLLGTVLGVSMTPYITDAQHINHPRGLAADDEGGLYVYEENGARVIKYNAQGAQVWTSGMAGTGYLYWNTNPFSGQTFYTLGGESGSMALDSSGNLYVPDRGNQRVVVLNAATGAQVAIMGMTGRPDDTYDRFNEPTGVAVSPLNGDIYVADQANQRVQVFTSARVYKATIGITGEEGDDNTHFRRPLDVAIDPQGAAYVADLDNRRIQKCTLVGDLATCGTFVGMIKGYDDVLNQFRPVAIKVDADGRVYVADGDHGRVLVYDKTGAFLTTIGNNNWSTLPGRLNSAFGLAVDADFNLYVADSGNNLVQKFALGVPGWTQANHGGFEDPKFRRADILGEHNGMLYATAGGHDERDGAQIWRSADGATWARVAVNGLNNTNNVRFQKGVSFGGYFYTGTENQPEGAQIWRCAKCDGSDWNQVVSGGLGDTGNVHADVLTVHDGMIYLSLGCDNDLGVSIWRSASGAAGTWTKVSQQGLGDVKNSASYNLLNMGGYLYVLTAQWAYFDYSVFFGNDGSGTTPDMIGMQVYRCAKCDGTDWQNVTGPDGLGKTDNMGNGIAVFNNALYVSSFNWATGAEVWRCEDCAGSDWMRVVDQGFAMAPVAGIVLTVYDNQLFALLDETDQRGGYQGANIYVTRDGTHWDLMPIHGFGTPDNNTITGSLVFADQLYLSTNNWQNGGQLWRMDIPSHPVFLPMVRH